MGTETKKTRFSGKMPAACLIGAGLLALALGAWLFLSTEGRGYTVTTFSMGSYVQQTVYGRNREEGARRAAEAAAQLDSLISWRKDGSDIARLNGAAGSGAVEIDSKTEQILSSALAVCEKSGGAFDITIAPVSRLWDFDGSPRLPDDAAIQESLKNVDYTALSVPGDGTASLLTRGAALDLGAVGKGAACDAAIAAYQAAGVNRAIVSVGGSVGVYGKKPFGSPWTVAVRDPSGEGSLGTLALGNGFVSTSGSYEKCFSVGGTTYHHLLDPSTGCPAKSGLCSVTVWSGSGALSDALSTACFVLGLEKSPSLLESFGAGAVFVTEHNQVFLTENLKQSFTLSAGKYTLEELP